MKYNGNNMDNTQKNSFDELVAGISQDERQFLLAKINQNKVDDTPLLNPLREEEAYNPVEIKLNSESFLYKFFIWLRTLITKRTKLEIYNQDLIEDLGRKINRKHPGIIDPRNALLQSLFFEKLKQLKEAADFFRPYFTVVNENPGRFYIFLSTFVAPSISASINEQADPYQIPFDRESTNELRTSLLKRMDGVLKDIPSGAKSKLYGTVRGLNWLDRFTQLPYLHFVAQFTAIVSEAYTCPYTNAQVDYPIFASVLSNAKSIPQEGLDALFLYVARKGMGDVTVMDYEGESAMKEFMAKAISHVSMIQMFISTVPLEALGKVLFADYDWQVGVDGGGEDWFIKFKEAWKVIFDERWEMWLRDKKKAQLAETLKEKFGVDKFPEIPYRPWAKLWGGIPFRCEMTGGFLTWFAANMYDEVMNSLNVIILEGIFINNENRAELSEAVNDFSNINQEVMAFVESISERGQIGSTFYKLQEEHIRSLKGQAVVDNIILNAEMNMRTWEKLFCDSLRTVERVLHGILDETKEKGYDGIQNLMTIRGHDNHAYREKLAHTREILLEARKILAEIEPLDLPKVNVKKGEK